MSAIKFQKNVLLAPYTTFKIGGPAKYFFIAKTSKDLLQAIEFARAEGLPFFILGGGSNLLISDKGFDGLVIKTQNTKCEIKNNRLIAEAGARLGDVVGLSIESGLTGLEWAVGIPGTVGGAVKVNAHAFGSDFRQLTKKTKEENGIILSVELKLAKGDKRKSEALIKEYATKRKTTQPLEYASAGCVFKNPVGKFAGQIIDQCGLKGRKIGGAEVSPKHANFIVNLGNATAKDVAELIGLIKETVKKKFGLELEEEIQRVGF